MRVISKQLPRELGIAAALLTAPIATAIYEFIPVEWNGAVVANWIQAIGSVFAIIAAGAFPIWHQIIARSARQRQLEELFRVLCEDCLQELWLLSNVFVAPEFEVSMMNDYLRFRRERSWGSLLSSLDQIPVAEIPPIRVADLARVKDAMSLGAYIANSLQEWIGHGSSRPDEIYALRAKRDLVGLIRTKLPAPTGLSNQIVDAQAKGQSHEHHSEPMPLGRDVKAYWRGHWRGVRGGSLPKRVQIQVVFPYGNNHPITSTIDAPESGWQSIYEMHECILKKGRGIMAEVTDKY